MYDNPVYSAQDRFITVHGLRIRYWDEGEGNPVVLIHGLGGYVEYWQLLYKELVTSRRVIALDLYGYGLSDKPPDRKYHYQAFATFMKGFLDVLGIEKTALVGHSLGGGISLQTVINEPGRFTSLCLISSGGLCYDFTPALKILSLPLIGEWMTRPVKKNLTAGLKAGMVNHSLIREWMIDQYFEMSAMPGARKSLLKTVRDGAGLFGGHKSVMEPILSNLGRIKCPTLMIWGRNDPVVDYGASKNGLAGIKNSRLMLLDRCGHFPMLEYPEETSAAVRQHLGESI